MPKPSNTRKSTSTKPGRSAGKTVSPRPRKAKAAERLASRTDRYTLYERAVQCVEAEIDFVDETFAKLRGRKARFLREDFCGTLNTSCEWVRRRKGNVAVGVDLDPVPLAWGRTHQLMALTAEQRGRVFIHQGDVLEAVPVDGLVPPAARQGIAGFPKFDAILAMNFSFWCFKQRETMLRYLRRVHESLADDGVLFMDFFGGPDALKEIRERRKIPRVRASEEGYREGGYNGPYTYIWDQASYDPITGDMVCHIHFRFPDGSAMRHAFSYHWRQWSLPELRDMLTEAGFKRTVVYWEGDDEKGGGNGVFTASEHGEACPSYICYVSAEKK